jgi:putative DNA primase/helicase
MGGAKMAVTFDALPNELKARNQWVLWKTITRAGKPTKVPYDTTGHEGDSSDPSRWESYDAVVATYQKGGYDGIGYTFDPLDPYAGVDLDHCINEDGSIKPKAKEILDRLNSYSEISPSGKGVKVFLKAKNPVKIRKDGGKFQQGFADKSPDLEFEVYYGYRFFTLTGNRLEQYSPNIENRNDELTEIFREVFKDRNYFDGDSEPIHRGGEPPSEPLSSDAVERLQGLFEADPTFKDEFYTPATIGHRSDAEFHICARLWEAGFNEDEIYQIMNSSPQTKWLERGDDYRWSTIKSAVASAEANHRKWAKEKAKKEAEKKAAPITLKDVADIEYDEDDKIVDVRFSPTFAARAILERMPLAMAEDSEDIYYFNGQIYKPDGARIIDLKLCDAAGDHVTGNTLRETLRRIRNELLEKPVVFDPDPYLLAVQNGVVSLLTGKRRDYRPEDLILDQIGVVFDPEAKCPWFIAFLESITPSIDDRIMLIDWFVATAIKEPLAYVLFLLGLGRNGKGIYERLIKKFFGQAAFRDMPLAEVSKNNFAASGFYRKRGWIASETGKKKTTIGTDFMKLVSGNGVIDGDRKNQSRIQFEPFFQTIVDTNTMPKIEDSSIGWIERFCKANLP